MLPIDPPVVFAEDNGIRESSLGVSRYDLLLCKQPDRSGKSADLLPYTRGSHILQIRV